MDEIQNGTFTEQNLVSQWDDIIQTQNRRLGAYGEENHLQLGTTVSAILLYKDQYYIVHVGDSRVYELTKTAKQLTNDQTFIARELAAGRMTPEQAKSIRDEAYCCSVSAHRRLLSRNLQRELQQEMQFICSAQTDSVM